MVGMAAVVVVAACGGGAMRVTSQTAPAADLGRYRTYAWRTPAPADAGRDLRDPGGLLDWRVRGAVDRGLAAKGYTPAGAGRPDFLVDYDVRVTDNNTESFSEWVEYRRLGGTSGLGTAFVSGFEEGSLILVVLDGRSGDLVWRGAATAVLESARQSERVDEAVRLVLARLPDAGAR